MKKFSLLQTGLTGTVLVALCCFTPILVVLLATVGLSALTGYLDYVLFPALAIFIGISIYAAARKNSSMRNSNESSDDNETK